MKYVFFGSPEMAAVVLGKLLDQGFVPQALVANPDRPVGRKQVITPPATKELILRRGLDGQVQVFQPEKARLIRDQLAGLRPDLLVVAAYANIIPQEVLDIPRLGALGVHPSLLPKYRGPSPVQTALLNGETQTGVSIYLLRKGVDDGPVLAQAVTPVGAEEDFPELLIRLAGLGADLLGKLIPDLLSGRAETRPQDEKEATFTRKFVTEDGFIPLPELQAAMKGDPARTRPVHDKIRALVSEPGAWTMKDGKRIKLLKARLENGKLVLLGVQREGKTPERYGEGFRI